MPGFEDVATGAATTSVAVGGVTVTVTVTTASDRSAADGGTNRAVTFDTLDLAGDDSAPSFPDGAFGRVLVVAFDGFTGLDDIVITVATDGGGTVTAPGIGAAKVSSPSFAFGGSGAIDDLQITPISVPAALPPFGLALGGSTLAGRRRRGRGLRRGAPRRSITKA